MSSIAAELNRQKSFRTAEWLVARKDFLAKEKEFTRLRDELSRQRRELPWEKVEKALCLRGPERHRDVRRSVRQAAAS